MFKIAKIKSFVSDHKDLIINTAVAIAADVYAETQSREVRNAAFIDSIFDTSRFAARNAR